MRLPWPARLVVGAVAVGGALILGFTFDHLGADGWPTWHQLIVLAVFEVLVVAGWLRPLIIYVGDQSEAVHLDEGFFVALVLLVPGSATLVTFGLATVVAQVVMRRALVKSVFNVGQTLISVGAGVGVFDLLTPAGAPLGSRVGPAIVGAAVFFIVNSAAVSAILAATGASARSALMNGWGIRLLLVGGGVVVAIATALVVTTYLWAIPLAVLPLLMLRRVLSGHFEARHDRIRLEGLFETTLEANRTMGREAVTDAILNAARTLLRCPEAALVEHPSDTDALSAPMEFPNESLWLTVSGRNRNEPFDRADRSLLEALAAVGTGALSNAALYHEVDVQRERLSAITSSLGEGVCAVDRSGHLTFVNPAATAMLGWDLTESLGDPDLRPDHGVGQSAPDFVLAPALRAMARSETIASYDTRFERASGEFFDVAFTVSPVVGPDGPTGAVLVFRDISERKAFEEQLARHAFHDTLTGLANRRLFLDHLDHALLRSERSGESHAVLFIDVDRFKRINDSLGHNAGDLLLIAVSERLQTALRPGDVLARFGGDEFTVLLEGAGAAEDAVAVAQRILDRLRDPIALPEGHEVVAAVSIGIALTSGDKSRDDVLHDADVAMYQAKVAGHGGCYEVFDVGAMGARSAERIDLEVALRRALDRNELEVYYQPLLSIGDGQVVGAEALVRWHHPERGLLEPGQFIALAEDTGLILPLGCIVLEHACRQARAWRERLGLNLSVGVNLSARQFQHAGLADDIEHVLRLTGVDPSQLCLEITESLAVENVERTREILLKAKALGVRVAIDDFGTGFSALGYLTSFPVDVVKIDRTFVEEVDTDPVKSAIVQSVVTLSRAIGTTTVVEGVETQAQLDHVRALGCHVVQGYYFARPVSVGDFEAFVGSNRPTGQATADAWDAWERGIELPVAADLSR